MDPSVPSVRSGAYVACVAARAPSAARSWWERAADRVSPDDDTGFAGAFAAAGRRLGAEAVRFAPNEQARLAEVGLRAPGSWALDDLGRAALLVRAAERWPFEAHVRLASDLFLKGDNRERRAVLQTLSVLPEPARFVPLAVEACRTNVVPVFEAVACDNPLPAACFPDLHFHQMVLKAIFVGVAVGRIEGLERRAGAELARMANDYASERRAAGRVVPPDVATVVRMAERRLSEPSAAR
jgi:hypothetical protein